VIRRVLVVFALMLVAQSAQGQIIGREQTRFSRDPIGWVSLGIGWMQQGGFNDPETGDGWDFGSAPQWRATLEFPVGRGATVGVAGTIARVPLIFDGSTCATARCDADANVSQLFGLFRLGGGSGLHQVIDIQAGITMFSNFREVDSGTRLGTGDMSQAFTFGIAYGFGYPLSPRTHVTLGQDWGLIILERQPGTSQRTVQQTSTRIGIRFGLGDR
jgi:hypothetical protein